MAILQSILPQWQHLKNCFDYPLLVEEVKEAFAKAFEKLYSASDLLDSTDWLKKRNPAGAMEQPNPENGTTQ